MQALCRVFPLKEWSIRARAAGCWPPIPPQETAGFDGGDWVTTGVPDGAQYFLASAVAAAADSRPLPPSHPSPQQSANPAHSAAMLSFVETAASFPLSGAPLNSDEMAL